MKETKKNNESATVVANQVAAKAETKAEAPKVTKERPKAEAQTAEQLQAEIEKKQRELQQKLQELEEKQKLNRNRSKFIDTLDNLDEYEGKLQAEEEFETNICRIKFTYGSYADKELFTVSNTALLIDFITFMRERIKAKVADIEQQLLK